MCGHLLNLFLDQRIILILVMFSSVVTQRLHYTCGVKCAWKCSVCIACTSDKSLGNIFCQDGTLVDFIHLFFPCQGSLDSVSECRARDWKVVSSNPGRSSWRIFFSRVNFVCWLLFRVWSTRMLLQWHVKNPGHSAKSAGGRLHLNPWPNKVRVGWLCHRDSVGTY